MRSHLRGVWSSLRNSSWLGAPATSTTTHYKASKGGGDVGRSRRPGGQQPCLGACAVHRGGGTGRGISCRFHVSGLCVSLAQSRELVSLTNISHSNGGASSWEVSASPCLSPRWQGPEQQLSPPILKRPPRGEHLLQPGLGTGRRPEPTGHQVYWVSSKEAKPESRPGSPVPGMVQGRVGENLNLGVPPTECMCCCGALVRGKEKRAESIPALGFDPLDPRH